MEYLVYRSKALVLPDSASCQSIVAISAMKNLLFGLTGFLHVEDGLFIQYIEGPPRPLWDLYSRLQFDERHTNMKLLGHGELRRPRFRKWSMGYSSSNVMSLKEFMAEATFKKTPEQASCAEAIWFLMGASARIDLGISSSV